jgi:signal transduction histidine kinase
MSLTAAGSRKIPLRGFLVVPFVLQIFTAVSLTGWLSLRNGQKAVNDVATQLRQELIARIEGELKQYINKPHDINHVNSAAFAQGHIDIVNGRNAKQFLTQVQISPFVFSSYCGDAQGYYLGATRRGLTIAMTASNQETNYHFSFYEMDNWGDRQKFLEKLKPYDPRQRPWYLSAVKAGQPTWSDIFVNLGGDGKPAITASEPVYDSEGKLLGVCATGVVLSENLREFLASLSLGKTGKAFVMARSGSMISSSTKEPLIRGKGENQKMIAAVESREPFVRETAKYLLLKFGSFDQIHQSEELEFTLNSERQFVQLLPLNDGRGIDWIIVVVVPESDFMEQINANTNTTILLCLLSLVIATGLGIITSQLWIAKPIRRLSQASQAIAGGNFEQNVPDTLVEELVTLSVSFNLMSHELKNFYQTLEQKVQERTKELRETQAQLIQSEKMSSLGQLVAGIAHEVNNPANFIHGNLSHLSQYTQDLLELVQLYQKYYPQPVSEIQAKSEDIDLEFLIEDLSKLLNSMKVGSERIRDIVKSLRNFSRLDEADFKAVDIHEGIESTLMILQNRLKARLTHPAIEVIKVYGNLPPIECYAGQLNQVFMNILTNALDALDERDQVETKTIRISTSLYNSEFVRICIADNGCGITEEVKQRIFDPFFTTKSVGKGTGMGMSISYQIVIQKHKGKLWCTSEPGEWTEFWIEIPLHQSVT